MRDESDLRGHGFTYEGSKPGAIVQGLIKMGVMNGMFILDEADKTEPFAIATLLEILDPEQNHLFHDKYTQTTVDIDLSNCHFILTANTLDTVPAPVDRPLPGGAARPLQRRREGRDRPAAHPPAHPRAARPRPRDDRLRAGPRGRAPPLPGPSLHPRGRRAAARADAAHAVAAAAAARDLRRGRGAASTITHQLIKTLSRGAAPSRRRSTRTIGSARCSASASTSSAASEA